MSHDRPIALRPDGLSWRELADQIVVLDAVSSTYLTVTGAGVPIWRALVRGATLDEILTELNEQFDVDLDVARADALQFIDELRSRGLLAST